MKKLLSLFLLVMLLITSCGLGSPGPDKTVDAFFTAAKTLDTQTMATLINPAKEEEIEGMKDFMKEEENDPFSSGFRDYFTEAATKISYKILETKIEEDRAKVSLEVQHVDSGSLLSDVFSEIFKRAFEVSFSGDVVNEEEMFTEIIADLVPETLEADATKTFTVELIKLEDKWYFDELNEELMDVLSAGFISAVENLDFFGGFDELEEVD